MDLKIENQILKFKIENSLFEKGEDKYLKQEGKGIGLKNIKDRLELIYKDKYSLNILNTERIFKVTLEIDLN